MCLLILTIALTSWLAFAVGQKSIPPEVTPQEQKLGEEAIKEFEPKVKIAPDHPDLPKLRAIVAHLATVTERPKVTYTIKVVQDDEPNAFTFPGGFMYVTTGLLKLAQSEHELAAVLAHEIAHNSRLHALRMLRKEGQLSIPVVLAMLASIFAKGETAGQAAQIVSQVVQVIMLGYSREMEREADEVAFAYLQKAGFNPVGLLTFFEKLERLEKRTPPVVLLPRYWTTHPALDERIEAIKRRLTQGGLLINRRPVTGALKVEVREIEVNGIKVAALVLDGEELCRFASTDGESALERAKAAAKNLDEALDRGAQSFDFRVQVSDNTLTVTIARSGLWQLVDIDANVNQQPMDKLATHIRQAITRAFLRGRISGRL